MTNVYGANVLELEDITFSSITMKIILSRNTITEQLQYNSGYILQYNMNMTNVYGANVLESEDITFSSLTMKVYT